MSFSQLTGRTIYNANDDSASRNNDTNLTTPWHRIPVEHRTSFKAYALFRREHLLHPYVQEHGYGVKEAMDQVVLRMWIALSKGERESWCRHAVLVMAREKESYGKQCAKVCCMSGSTREDCSMNSSDSDSEMASDGSDTLVASSSASETSSSSSSPSSSYSSCLSLSEECDLLWDEWISYDFDDLSTGDSGTDSNSQSPSYSEDISMSFDSEEGSLWPRQQFDGYTPYVPRTLREIGINALKRPECGDVFISPDFS